MNESVQKLIFLRLVVIVKFLGT